jgi:hypothetical protein
MPTVDVEENIKKLRMNIEQLTQEVFRLQGMLQTFEGFKKGGLTQIELPQDPTGGTSSRVSKRSPSDFLHSKHP